MKPGAQPRPCVVSICRRRLPEFLFGFAPKANGSRMSRTGGFTSTRLPRLAADLGAVSSRGGVSSGRPTARPSFRRESPFARSRRLAAHRSSSANSGAADADGPLLPDDTIVFSILQRASTACGRPGTPELHVPLDPARRSTPISSRWRCNRLVPGVHVRGKMTPSVSHRRERPRTTCRATRYVFQRFVLPNNLLFIRRWRTRLSGPPFENGALDMTRAAMVQPGADRLRRGARRTLLMRFTARDRRNLVWVTRSGRRHGSGPRARDYHTSFELAPEGGRVLMSPWALTSGQTRGTLSRHGHGYPGAAASAGGRDDVGATVSWAPGDGCSSA